MKAKALTKHVDIEMLKGFAESAGYSLSQLSKMYGRNANYFNQYEMSQKGFKIRRPEFNFIMDVLNGREYDSPMMVEKAVLEYWAGLARVTISDICKAIDRSVSYISNKKKGQRFLLYAGEVKIIKNLLGISTDQLGMSIDEIEQKDESNQYVTDLESLAGKMQEEKNPLAEYSDEEILAEIKRRMEDR